MNVNVKVKQLRAPRCSVGKHAASEPFLCSSLLYKVQVATLNRHRGADARALFRFRFVIVIVIEIEHEYEHEHALCSWRLKLQC